jgi:FlaG/FlaF family flagellin (archaellin)
MKVNQDDAVSPVVGVMLILVVTIIIAAVVSAFSGGLASTNSKSPQVSLSGSYSITKGLSITNDGGDALNVGDQVSFYTHCSPTWGTSASKMNVPLNISQMVDSKNAAIDWLRPGDTIYILPPYSEGPWLQPGVSKTYWYNNTDNIGKPVIIEALGTTGRAITSMEVLITP